MKRAFALLAALALVLTAVAALAEEYDKADPEAKALYDSEWVSEEAWMDIAPQDGELKVQIRQFTEYPNAYWWEYTGEFDPETKALKAVRNAVKFNVVYREDEEEIVGTVYEEPADASFEINADGRLIWHDGKEDAGKGIAFTRIGRFNDTTWACDRATIEIAWQEEGYKVFIQWGSSAWESTEWEYSCYYDADTNTMTSMPTGVRSEVVYNEDGTVASWKDVYEDGEATFRLDDDGHLIWEDAKEDAGHGMLFEQVPAE